VVIRFCFLFCVLFFTVCLAGGQAARAGGGPEGVAVVINGKSWASRTIANEYLAMRGIPASHVVVLNEIPDHETISVEQFRKSILIPVLEKLEKNGVLAQLDCITYSSDIPVAIQVGGDVGNEKLPKILTKVASINGLTYLYQSTLAKNPSYLNLNANWSVRNPVLHLEMKPVTERDQKLYQETIRLIKVKKWEKAASMLQDFCEKYPDNPLFAYNQACVLAQLGKTEKAFAALSSAIKSGFRNRAHIEKDPDLVSLRKQKKFQQILDKIKPIMVSVQPSLAFDAQALWNSRGKVADEGNGQKYLLSTVLAVTSGRGNSVRDALDSLRSSVRADGTHPQGTVYYMKNSNVRSTTRAALFESAVVALKELGVNAVIEEGSLPQKKKDVLGAMIGSAGFDWEKSQSRILPGAICEHLTSFGAVMRENAGQTPCTELIRAGASGTSGTVTEPFALQAKFPNPFIHVHYVRGCSLAEAFYQSVAGPYQLLIIGDPLCQPWAQTGQVQVEAVKSGDVIKGKRKLAPKFIPASKGSGLVGKFQFFLDGKALATISADEKFEFDSTRFSDGNHLLSVVAFRDNAIQTQSRFAIPVTIHNNNRTVSLSIKEPAKRANEFTSDQILRLSVSAPGAKRILFRTQAEELTSCTNDEDEVEIKLSEIGEGPVRIWAIAQYQDGNAESSPVRFRIIPSSPMKSKIMPLAQFRSLKSGLELTSNGRKTASVSDTYKHDWLEKRKLQEGSSFSLRGLIQSSHTETHQFQINSNCLQELVVNGHVIWKVNTTLKGTGGWIFVPVSLENGIYEVVLRGTTVRKPRLAIRFGGDGCKSLGEKNSRH